MRGGGEEKELETKKVSCLRAIKKQVKIPLHEIISAPSKRKKEKKEKKKTTQRSY